MIEYNCPDCKDTGVYQGLNTVEPCRACERSLPPELAQVTDCGRSVERFVRDEICKQIAIETCGQSMRHEIEEQIAEPKPFDEIMPAELDDIEVGRFISVSIHCENINRLFGVVHRVIDRPLFGFPAKTMQLIAVEIKNGEATGTLIVRPFGEGHVIHLRRIMMPVETHQIYETDPCQDMLFIPILED